MLAGSVGPTKRMEYTAIGGNVTLAARLESANKYFGTVVQQRDPPGGGC
jgi:class 3 adenylate cyclase